MSIHTYAKKVGEFFRVFLRASSSSSGQWTNSYRFALVARFEELQSASGLVPNFAFWDVKQR